MEKEWLDMGIDDVEKDCLESKTSDPKMLTCGGGTVGDLPLWRPARSRCGVAAMIAGCRSGQNLQPGTEMRRSVFQ